MSQHRDVVVIGGGIVGLATAHRLLEARDGLTVTVLEREQRVGQHQSSRNSGVLHAGLYYPPGSAKARWCREGKAALERFCAEHGVTVARTGKVVVAVRGSELPGLRALAERSRANGVHIEELDAAGLRQHEPHVTGIAGLWTPETAVTDFGAVCDALARVVQESGGELRLHTEVVELDERDDHVRITTTSGPLTARVVIACAGLRSDRVAALTGDAGDERIVPFRGSWLVLRPERAELVRGNVYPVPQPGLPFLGVHLTRRVDGQVWIGPNAVLALAREGRRPWSVRLRDTLETLRYPGLWRLAARNARVAIGELWRDLSLAATIREVRRYIPAITVNDVARGPWGVRAQAVRRDGTLVDDFSLGGDGRVLHVRNAPSPAATASLAIGAELRDRALARL